MSKQDWHSGRILYALAYHFDWRANRMMTEWSVDGGIADLLFMTKAGYLTEIEVKVSISDWNADRQKEKFLKPRPHISRFFYAIPETLIAKIPAWVPAGAGILVVSANNPLGRDTVREHRAAKRVKSNKMTDVEQNRMLQSCYYRYWGVTLNLMWQSICSGKKNSQKQAL